MNQENPSISTTSEETQVCENSLCVDTANTVADTASSVTSCMSSGSRCSRFAAVEHARVVLTVCSREEDQFECKALVGGTLSGTRVYVSKSLESGYEVTSGQMWLQGCSAELCGRYGVTVGEKEARHSFTGVRLKRTQGVVLQEVTLNGKLGWVQEYTKRVRN